MIRILSFLAALLIAGPAAAQPMSPMMGTPPSLWPSDPAGSADRYSVQSQAPRRSMMSITVGAQKPNKSAPSYSTLSTYLLIWPVHAQTYAVRVGFADPFSTAEQIVSVGIYPSDSYGGPIYNISQWHPVGTGGGSTNTSAYPTANSVYQSCTTTSGSASVVCSDTSLLPSAATMYVLGANIATTPTTGTVADATHVTLSANATASGTTTLQFANLATECTGYFDNKGAAVNSVNTSGTATGLTITANPTGGSSSQSFVLNGMSDFVPCATVAQASPVNSNTHLLFIYVTLGPNTTALNNNLPTLPVLDNNAHGAASFGNQYVFGGIAWNGNTDYAGNPAGTGFKGVTVNPIQVIQYLTPTRGWNILQAGDSISQSPNDDNFSNAVMRACWTVSTLQAPCEWSQFAQGGNAWAQYGEAVRSNTSIMQPSAIVGQTVSRNEGGVTVSIMQTLFARWVAAAQAAQARIGFLGAFPLTTTADASAAIQTAIATVRSQLAAVSTTCQPSTGGRTCPYIPVLDPVPYISALPFGGNAWDYPSISAVANGSFVAGATTINYTGAVQSCYAGWQVRDITNPTSFAANATVTSCSGTGFTISGAFVTADSAGAADVLEFAIPGFVMGAHNDTAEGFSADNTHPWYPAHTELMNSTVVPGATPAITFVKQLLGIQ